MKPDLSIIILNHNAKDFLRDNLESIQKQKDLRLEIIVVDNNSIDDSREMVVKEFPSVSWIQRKVSHGFAAGNNVGVQASHADTVLFLNPDTKLLHASDLKKCYDKLMSDQKIGVLTCRLNLALTGKIDETCHRGFPTPWAALTYFSGLARAFPDSKLCAQYLESYKGYETEHAVDAVGGMFMLMRRKVGEEVGWWDEEYPLYGEDLDFCYRLKQKGYYNLYWPSVVVLHYKGVSTGMSKHSRAITKASKATTRQVKLWSIEAMETFYRKHYMQLYPFFINWLVFLGIKLLKFQRVYL